MLAAISPQLVHHRQKSPKHDNNTPSAPTTHTLNECQRKYRLLAENVDDVI